MVLRPKPRNHRSDFEAQITKPKLPVLRPKPGNPPPPWFWGSTKKPTTGFVAKPGETITTSFEAKLEKTVTAGFEAKPSEIVVAGFVDKPPEIVAASFEAKPLETVTTDFVDKWPETVAVGFEDKPPETVAAGFEDKPLETVTTGFEAKPTKTVQVVLRPNHSQTVDLGFEARPRNPCSTSPRGRCRLHTAPPNLSIARPPSTRPVRSSPVLCTSSPTPATMLIAARQASPTTCTPWDKRTWFSKRNKGKRKTQQNCLGFEFKPHQVNDSSQSNQGTDHLISHQLLAPKLLR
jgi:hypothetical protein